MATTNNPSDTPPSQQAPGDRNEELVARVITFLIVLALPVVSFPLGSALRPDWQNGNITDRVGLHLDPEVTIYFAPFIVIAWFAVLASIANEAIVARSFIARLAVYSAVPMTLQYLVIASIQFVATPIAFGLIAIAGWIGLGALHRRTDGRSTVVVAAVAAALWLSAVVVSGLLVGLSVRIFVQPFAIPILLLLLAGPMICFAIAVHRSMRLWRASQSSASSMETVIGGVGVGTWLAGYGLAWRAGTAKAVAIYESLPVEQPTCYVATAAAAGHRSVVRSHQVVAEDGTSFAVTRQLQTLKIAEIVIAARLPQTHGWLRRMYDALGPRAAARLKTAIRADLAYLALKPAEALGAMLVAVAVPDARATRNRMYRQPKTAAAPD